jgi:hypothetical protein
MNNASSLEIRASLPRLLREMGWQQAFGGLERFEDDRELEPPDVGCYGRREGKRSHGLVRAR